VDSGKAREIVKRVQLLQRNCRKKLGESFVYLADELYMAAGFRLPARRHYGDFWQIENGVGLVRTFITEFQKAAKTFPRTIHPPKNIILITGILAAPILRRYVLPRLCRIRGLTIRLEAVPNTFYGETVTVSGLLTGQDLIRHFQARPGPQELILPVSCLNDDGKLLDDLTPADLAVKLDRPVRAVTDIQEIWETNG
jgi:NifB/MoaA-like Fe-S oxidoreductase